MKRYSLSIIVALALALLFAGCKEKELSTMEQLEYAIGKGRVEQRDDGNYYTVNPHDLNDPNGVIIPGFKITADPEIEFYSGEDYSLSLSAEKYVPGDTIKIALANNADYAIDFLYCYMEMFLDDAWHRISGNIGSKGSEQSLNANSIREIDVTPQKIRLFFTHTTDPETGEHKAELEPLILKPGTYRIRVGLGYSEKHILCKEFTVE